MEGIKLMFIGEKQTPYGLMKTYESAFYKVQMCYIGDLEQDRASGEIDKGFLKVDVKPLEKRSLPLTVAPRFTKGTRTPIAMIETDYSGVDYTNIESYIEKMRISKETLNEIDSVIRKEYPDFYLLNPAG